MTVLLALALGVAAVAAVRGMWSPCGLSMLSALNPVAEAARGHRYWLTAGWYVAGAAAGGAALGGLCAALAIGYRQLPIGAPVTWTLACLAAVVTLAADSGVPGLRLPTIPRQVDERWLTTYRRWVYAGGFGLQIGAGLVTYVMTSAVYLTAALAVLTASPLAALVLGVTFGVVRGLLIAVVAPVRTGEKLRAVMRHIDRLAPVSIGVARGAELAVAVAASWLAAGPLAAGATAAVLVALLTWRRLAGAHRDVEPSVGACSGGHFAALDGRQVA